MEWRQIWYEKTTRKKEDLFHAEEELFVLVKKDCIAKILYAKYKPANHMELTTNLQQLTFIRQEQL